ncbi:hypothetical protein [Leptospira noumeaensis]|uniref:hypothetical protein n=1 Tax=Leptospira noumeaensis TaxID=2484964 RepID=UPI00142E899E|nr:hypothetical protein [Leptospira noumeaensis]
MIGGDNKKANGGLLVEFQERTIRLLIVILCGGTLELDFAVSMIETNYIFFSNLKFV